MNFLQDIMIDSLNGFSLSFIPFFLFQVFSAAFMAHIFQGFINRKAGSPVLQYAAIIAASACVLTAVVKYSLPFSVLAAALLILFVKPEGRTKIAVVSLFIVLLLGLGCGVGSVFLTFLGFILIGLITLFTPIEKNE